MACMNCICTICAKKSTCKGCKDCESNTTTSRCDSFVKAENRMKELTGVNLFDFDNIVITTNGTIKKNGAAVLGRGCAETMRDTYKGFDAKLGKYLSQYGNRAFMMGNYGPHPVVITMPVKDNWNEKAKYKLIEKSAREIMEMLDKFNIDHIYIPRPGCGNGGLSWDKVKPRIDVIFDSRVTIITY